MRKKSQSEIVGLLVIVILVSFIMLFVFYLIIQPPEPSVGDKIDLASSYVGAILKTTAVGCYGDGDVQNLIIECVKSGGKEGNRCKDNNTIRHCEYVRSTISETLDNSLKKWNKEYEFKVIDYFGRTVVHINSSDLTYVRSGETFTQPLPVVFSDNDKDYNIFVKLCIGKCRD